MLRRGRRRAAIPRLRHEQVVEKFVDYHFGRLSPEMNKAIERHVRSCARCKREGLTNAANERKGAVRKLRSVRGGKPLLGRRGRMWIMLLTIILLMQVVIYEIANGHAGALAAVLSQRGSAQVSSSTAPPVALSPSNALPLITGGASAVALSPDDKRLAVAGGSGQRGVTIWDIANDKPVTTLAWSGASPPASVAWSADGGRLAAADGSQAVIWDLSTVATGVTGSAGSILWQLTIPAAPALRVYDVSQQVIVSRPDPATAFRTGAMAWGADGALSAAPAGALGPVGVSTPQSPVVGMWSSAGSHIFAGGGGAALVGSSTSDVSRGVALLDWSPDGHYLLWGALTQPIAVGAAQAAKTASQPPDNVVADLATRIGTTGANASAIVWFAPVGKLVAVCDQTSASAHVQIVEIATARVAYTLGETCAGLTAHSALWSSTGKAFYIIPAKGPIEIYTIAA